MFSADDENILIVVAGTIMLLLLGIFIISFLFFYQRKRTAHITEQEHMRSAFSREILTTQLEVQEQTLNYISQELHDNIGQVLSFVKLNLGTAVNATEAQKQRKIEDSRELVAQVITDLRDLSNSLSFQQITQQGLIRAIKVEIERVNKSGLLKIDTELEGEPYSLGEQRELVIFRIFQESLNNALKYAHALRLEIYLSFTEALFTMRIHDNGIGFAKDQPGIGSGAGLKNIENRAGLIGAAAILESAPGAGCTITITLNPAAQLINDGTDTNSPG